MEDEKNNNYLTIYYFFFNYLVLQLIFQKFYDKDYNLRERYKFLYLFVMIPIIYITSICMYIRSQESSTVHINR